MKATMKFSALAAATLTALGLTGCDSITTVGEEPTFDVPAQKVVLGGTVTGLSATRPLVLNVALTNNGPSTGTTTTNVVGTNVLRLGAIDIGGGYNVTVNQNPYGRICSVANGSGVATAPVENIAVTCVRDPAVPLYTATLNINPTLANALPPNFRVSLTTEEGVETITPTAGQTSVVFTNPIIASGTQLPTFTYLFNATTESGGVVGTCSVSTATNIGGSAPTGNVSGTVNACAFTIGGAASGSGLGGGVGYLQPPHIAYTAKTITGLQLGLKQNDSQEVIETLDIPPYSPAAPGTASTAFAFATPRLSTSSALYEVVVTTQPTGMHCIVDNGGLASLMVRPMTTASGISTPASQPASITNIGVRCRDLPSANGTLVGTYQLLGQNTTFTAGTTVTNTRYGTADPNGVGTTTTVTVGAGTPTVTSADPSFDRRFMTFFANGTFLYAVHGTTTTSNFFGRSLNTCTTCGVEYGFYFYDNVTGTIYFSTRTDTNGTTANSLTSGLSGMPGLVAGAPTMNGVVKAAAARDTLTGTFGTTAANMSTWSLVEPVQTAGELEGAWTTADSKRVFVYTKDGFRTAFHYGINGAPNMQDGCIGILDPTVSEGFWTSRDRSTGCVTGAYPDPTDTTFPVTNLGGYTPIDIPEAAGTTTQVGGGSTLMGANQAIWPGYQGRMPGLQSNDSVTISPSPVLFEVAGDTLTVQDTQNGTPVGAPIVMQRMTPN